MTYGNRQGGSKGLRLATWNPGSAHLPNKVNEIEYLIAKHRPHLLIVTEANLFKSHDLTKVKIPKYDIIVSDTMKNSSLNYSRTVAYVHEDISVNVRHDLMDQDVSSIWLSLGHKNQKKILVGGLYREWNLLGGGNGSVDDPGSPAAQLVRWNLLLEKWRAALEEDKEVVLLGDINLDWFTCLDSDPPPNSKAYRLKPLVTQLLMKIFTFGVCQLVNTVTRSWQGHPHSCLDLIFTNRPERSLRWKFLWLHPQITDMYRSPGTPKVFKPNQDV